MSRGDHPLLSETQKQTLVQKCQNWKKAFEEQLAEVATAEDFLLVKQKTDQTVSKAATALAGILEIT